jgi:uncharacterized protein YecE (DUF72 family)
MRVWVGTSGFSYPPWRGSFYPEKLRAPDMDLLAEKALGLRAAFEFRHASWFSDDVYATLHAAKAALCIAEADKLETPLQATAPWGYLRLRRADYTAPMLDAWATRIAGQAWSEVYVFVKQETAEAPALARHLLASFRQPNSSPLSCRGAALLSRAYLL